MERTKNYIRGIIFQLIPFDKREEVTGQIFEQTKDLKQKIQIEYIVKGILLKHQQNKEQENRMSRVAKDISEILINVKDIKNN